MKDAAGAIGTYQALLRRFGQDRDVLALLLPLLEGEGRWAEMAEALAQDAALAPRAERAVILARMGVLRLERLGNAGSAIDAFAEALVVDEREPTARASLKLAAGGEATGRRPRARWSRCSDAKAADRPRPRLPSLVLSGPAFEERLDAFAGVVGRHQAADHRA